MSKKPDKPTERRVKVPKGAVWVEDESVRTTTERLLAGKKIIGEATPSGWATLNASRSYGNCNIGNNKDLLEKALADAGEDGFRWEEVEPEYTDYEVEARYHATGNSFRHGCSDYVEAKEKFDDFRNGARGEEPADIIVIYGNKYNLQRVELDRHDAEEKP